MYGFAIGAWLAGIKRFDLHLQLMAQVSDHVGTSACESSNTECNSWLKWECMLKQAL